MAVGVVLMVEVVGLTGAVPMVAELPAAVLEGPMNEVEVPTEEDQEDRDVNGSRSFVLFSRSLFMLPWFPFFLSSKYCWNTNFCQFHLA